LFLGAPLGSCRRPRLLVGECGGFAALDRDAAKPILAGQYFQRQQASAMRQINNARQSSNLVSGRP
jgi:hypothetical protein